MRPFALALALAAPSLLTAAAPAQQAGLDRARRLAPLGDKPARTVVTADHEGHTLFVKFVDGSGVRLDAAGHFAAPDAEVEAVDLLLDSMGAVRERLWLQDDATLQAWRAIGEARSGLALHDLTLFYRVRFDDAGRVGPACDALNAFRVVRLAWPVGTVGDPTAPAATVLATPDFEGQQLYRGPAPDGVDADYGNTFAGGWGTGRTIVDVETGWTHDHEDLAHKALNAFTGLCCAPYPWDHGTAVLGELIGEDQGFGVRGIVYDADVLLSTHQGAVANIPTAIANAVAAALPGDVVVLEVQCFQGPPSPHPCEWDDAIFATVQTATAMGIHVFAASGNGDNDLDSPAYGGKFDRNVRDSGAVMVGASNGILLDKASFSNYGSRLDAHGWGWNVTSAGYGDLFGANVLEEYTATFSGTSSATPIVTGAGIQVLGIYEESANQPMDPLTLRALLTATGTPQGAGGQIGPRPDVRAAVAALGLTRVDISGNLVVGGSYTVTSRGTAGDPNVLIFANQLNLANPMSVPPYGHLLLGGVLRRMQTGVLDGNGELDFGGNIPNDGSLSGTTIGWFQNWQRFLSGQPGVGAFGNYVALAIQ